jgi:hypothetical protein
VIVSLPRRGRRQPARAPHDSPRDMLLDMVP